MKVVNTMKLKEELDYENLCCKLESQLDYLNAEMERQQKLSENNRGQMEQKLKECQNSFAEAEKDYSAKIQVVSSSLSLSLMVFMYHLMIFLLFLALKFHFNYFFENRILLPFHK